MFYVKAWDVGILCDALEVVYPEGDKCDDAFRKFRESHADVPWSSQLPTRPGFCGLLEKAVLDGERFWRRRELENLSPAAVASPAPQQREDMVAGQDAPLAEEGALRTRHWSSSPSDGESWPRFDDERYRIVISRSTGQMAVSRMQPMPESSPESP